MEDIIQDAAEEGRGGRGRRQPRSRPRKPSKRSTSTSWPPPARKRRSSSWPTSSSSRPSRTAPATSTSSRSRRCVRLRYRVDGVLIDATPPPKQMQLALVSRFKIMSSLDIAERRLPQDGRMRMRVGGKDYDLRVSIMPTVHGEKIVLRVLDKSNLSASIDKLGPGPGHLPAVQGRRGCAARLDPGHRPDRFRQDHHALFRAQRAQQPDLQHRHRRGPGRIPDSRHQPGAGRRRKSASPSPTRCAPFCARTRTSS